MLDLDDVCLILQEHQIAITPPQKDLLQAYHSALLEWNAKVNLISKKNESLFWEKHLLHSLSVLIFFPISQGISICDLGTGGGLPGIPISILRPDLKMTLMDSIQKKTKALQSILQTLHLQNIDVACGRAEYLGTLPQYTKKFDAVLARAVSSLANIECWTRHLRKSTSIIYAYKGGDFSTEIQVLKKQTNDLNQIQEKLIDFKQAPVFLDKKIIALYF